MLHETLNHPSGRSTNGSRIIILHRWHFIIALNLSDRRHPDSDRATPAELYRGNLPHCHWLGRRIPPVNPLSTHLACIDHKSSAAVATVTLNSIRICAECRLWQRNSPAGAENHLRSSSYGVFATRVRSRHSEATAEFRCSSKRRL